jgi:hypothetical protein
VTRPRASELAEPVPGGVFVGTVFYPEHEWQRLERRRAQWRESKRRYLMDPDQRRLHLERAKATNRKRRAELNTAQQRKRHMDNEAWQRECLRRYVGLSDDVIRLRILEHEIELRMMRTVLAARRKDQAA